MYIADLRTNVIHDAMNSKYECHLKDIPKDQQKRVFTKQSVERMCGPDHSPRFQGCQYCLSEYYIFDFNKIFGTNA